MEKLLFLVHRIPYPPTKGDKIRSWHLLERLTEDYRIHLGTFIDDPRDWEHVPHVRSLCEDACFVGLSAGRATLRSARGFLTGEPLSVLHYRDKKLQRWVDSSLSSDTISRILVFSSVMAQYVALHTGADLRKVIDFVDVDSDKWRQYSEKKAWPMSWIYRREGRRLLEYERMVSAVSDVSVFVSGHEAALFSTLAPECAERVMHVNNGVDSERFSPDAVIENPYPADERVLVFTGAMDYWANVDAVTWFAREVFPVVRRHASGTRLYIVGARPTAAVRALQTQPEIVVTGAVEDVRPYLAHATVAVAPMRVARGVQNKVLEALAMGTPLVATTAAMEGIEPWPDGSVAVADDAPALAEVIAGLLDQGGSLCRRGALRQWIANNYSWRRNLGAMVGALERGSIVAGGESAQEGGRNPHVGMVG